MGRNNLTCPATGKQVHPSRARAQDHRRSLRVRMGVTTNVYRCEYCDYWHVGGGRPKGDKRKERVQ